MWAVRLASVIHPILELHKATVDTGKVDEDMHKHVVSRDDIQLPAQVYSVVFLDGGAARAYDLLQLSVNFGDRH